MEMLEKKVTKGYRRCAVCTSKINKGDTLMLVKSKSSGGWAPAHWNICADCQKLTLKAMYLKQELDNK